MSPCRQQREGIALKGAPPPPNLFIQRGLPGEGETEKQHSLSRGGQKSNRLIDLMILFRSQHNKANSFLLQFKTSCHRSSVMQTHHQSEKGEFWQSCMHTKEKLLVVRASPDIVSADRSTDNGSECAILFSVFVLNCRAQSSLAIPELRQHQLPEEYFAHSPYEHSFKISSESILILNSKTTLTLIKN